MSAAVRFWLNKQNQRTRFALTASRSARCSGPGCLS